MSTSIRGQVGWHGDEITFETIYFTMSQLRVMIRSLCHMVWLELLRDLLLLDVDDDSNARPDSMAKLPEIDLNLLSPRREHN